MPKITEYSCSLCSKRYGSNDCLDNDVSVYLGKFGLYTWPDLCDRCAESVMEFLKEKFPKQQPLIKVFNKPIEAKV